jgi:lia operon protein LiaG
MKKMKYSFLLVASLSVAALCRAQDYKVTVENSKDAKLVLEGFPEDLSIEGYAGTEIVVSGGKHENNENSDRAKGLKPVYAAGTDNTGFGLAMEKDGSRVYLRCLLPITQSGRYKIRVPETLALEITRDCARGGETTISNMKNEIEFKGCHDISLKDVTGPLVISTISGNVNVAFTDISKDKPISIASVSGEVDVTMPAKAGFNLEMGTVSGNMYSDFDFPTSKEGDMQRVGGNTIRAKINGGGIDLRLHSVSGNVYLRKG